MIQVSFEQSFWILTTYHGHSTKERRRTSDVRRGEDGFNRADVVARVLAVRSAESKGGRNDGDEHEERHSDGLLVEVDHLRHPVGADGATKVLDDTLSPAPGRVQMDLSGIGDEIFVDTLLLVLGEVHVEGVRGLLLLLKLLVFDDVTGSTSILHCFGVFNCRPCLVPVRPLFAVG